MFQISSVQGVDVSLYAHLVALNCIVIHYIVAHITYGCGDWIHECCVNTNNNTFCHRTGGDGYRVLPPNISSIESSEAVICADACALHCRTAGHNQWTAPLLTTRNSIKAVLRRPLFHSVFLSLSPTVNYMGCSGNEPRAVLHSSVPYCLSID